MPFLLPHSIDVPSSKGPLSRGARSSGRGQPYHKAYLSVGRSSAACRNGSARVPLLGKQSPLLFDFSLFSKTIPLHTSDHVRSDLYIMATDIRTSELKSPIDVAEYLFRRLHEVGVRGVHGVPGDFNLVRYKRSQHA